ncbi:MAG: ribosome silencing factor [Alphaproteobacteria bacterium]|nr:ribosome silencing factor [Alphaproteobacteria bacterium]
MLGLVGASLDDDQAEDVVVVDLRGRSTLADYVVIASGQSTRKVGAMATHLVEKLKAHRAKVRAEGMRECDWVLIDGGDVIVHLFRPEVRAFYKLEKMWGIRSSAGEPAMDDRADDRAALSG